MFVPFFSPMILAASIGWLMAITVHMLFYALLVLSFASWVDSIFIFRQMEHERDSEEAREMKALA
jgi:hypothetical protein